jgi:hypothetical protein
MSGGGPMKRMLDGAAAILAMVLLTNPAAVLGSVAPAVVYDFTERLHFLPRQPEFVWRRELNGLASGSCANTQRS